MGKVIFTLLLIQSFVAQSLACSAFGKADSAMVLGKSYDWDLSHGLMVVNKRNVRKTSITSANDHKTVTWVAKYGSLTFNQYGREFPNGGLNEKGLAIEVLWHFGSEMDQRSPIPALNEAQWIQYHLDNAASIPEMLRLARTVRLHPVFAQVHYFACDPSGQCAVFEYIKGELKTYAPSSLGLPLKALTNDSYLPSSANAQQYQGLGGTKAIPMGTYDSKDRFVRVAALSANISAEKKIAASFKILDTVISSSRTQWHLVYDLKTKEVHFKQIKKGRRYKKVDIKQFDYSCQKPVQILDLDAASVGDVSTQFTDYSYEKNYAVVKKSGTHHKIPDAIITIFAQYPDTTECGR